MKDILYFLRDLCVNNNRDWFDANRTIYKKHRADFESIVEKMIHEVALFDNSIAQLSPKDCMFRINRDTRFSLDKTPYKTNFGAFLAPGGKGAFTAGYYLHIEPDNSFIAGGIYMPPSDVLLKLRTAIYENPKSFIEIIENPLFKETFGAIDAETLKGVPRGFAKTFEHLNLIQYKSYTVTTPMSDEFVEHNDVYEKSIHCFEAMHAFNSFLNKALE